MYKVPVNYSEMDVDLLDEDETCPTLENFYLNNFWDDFESLPGAEAYPMTYALTYEEEELLWRYEIFEDSIITFFDQQGNLNFNRMMKTLIADYTSEFEKYEGARKWRREYDQEKRQNKPELEDLQDINMFNFPTEQETFQQ